MTAIEQHRILREYLLAKAAVGDWHGVSDAANDLRVLEAGMSAADIHAARSTCR